MSIFNQVIWHLTKHRIMGEVSIKLTGLAIFIIAITSLLTMAFKRDRYENYMSFAGIAARVLMLCAFSIEFYHHIKVYSGSNLDFSDKGRILEHVDYMLIFGFMIVIGIFYILTMGVKEHKGLFYTFDIGMILIPTVIQIPAIVYVIIKSVFTSGDYSDLSGIISVILFILFDAFLLVLFFRAFWKKGKRDYIYLFISICISTIIIALSGWRDVKYSSYAMVIILVVLLTVNSIISRWVTSNLKDSNTLRFGIIGLALCITVLSNPLYSLWKYSLAYGSYEISDSFDTNTQLLNIHDAEKLARGVIGDGDGPISKNYTYSQNFHNVYCFTFEQYIVNLRDKVGTPMSINFNDDEYLVGEVILNEDNIIRYAKDWLKKNEIIVNEDFAEFKIIDEDDVYCVEVDLKYSNGLVDDKDASSIRFFKDGKLHSLHMGATMLKEDIDSMRVTEIVNQWYKVIGAKPRFYTVLRDAFDNKSYIKTQFYDKIYFDDKGVYRYSSGGNTYEGDFDEGLKIAKDYLKILRADNSYILVDKSSNSGWYSFEDQDNKSRVNIGIDKEGGLSHFSSNGRVRKRRIEHKSNDFQISALEAVNLVTKDYKPLGIYSKRVLLSDIIEEDKESSLKWMVIVFPMGINEHHVYTVDTQDGSINELYGYRVGAQYE